MVLEVASMEESVVWRASIGWLRLHQTMLCFLLLMGLALAELVLLWGCHASSKISDDHTEGAKTA